MRKPVCILALMLVLLLAGCSQDNQVVGFDAPAWEAELLKYRKDKDERFRSSGSSPMAGTQYLKSEPTDRVWLTRNEKTFALSYSEPVEAVLSLDRSSGPWSWNAKEEGVVGLVGDETIADGAILEGPATFRIDELELSFYPSDERATFIVFDPERSEKQSFEQLLYFVPDRDYVVDARLERVSEPDVVELLTNRNLVKEFYRYAKIRFELDGREHELSAFKSALTGADSDRLFIPFRDATTGNETYGAGRFIRIDVPEHDRFWFDLNRAFNPYCAYSPAWNCSIPPVENHLDVPIRAGEKTYAQAAH